MQIQILSTFKSMYKLTRSIAVVASSIAAITSSLLPLLLYTTISTTRLGLFFLLLCLAAFTIHGILTDACNDYTDTQSGPEWHSPWISSGGSRVIQTDSISPKIIWRIAIFSAVFLLLVAGVFCIAEQYNLTALLLIGIWAAVA